MDNKQRVISLECVIQTEEYPQWIIDNHMGNISHDIHIRAITEGCLGDHINYEFCPHCGEKM